MLCIFIVVGVLNNVPHVIILLRSLILSEEGEFGLLRYLFSKILCEQKEYIFNDVVVIFREHIHSLEEKFLIGLEVFHQDVVNISGTSLEKYDVINYFLCGVV
jgi:hypothetical protein